MGKPLASNPITASLLTSFSDSGSRPIVIEPDPSFYPDFDTHLIVFPINPTALATDVGYVFNTGATKIVPVPTGTLTFSGGISASLPKEPHTYPEFQVMFAFSAEDGSPISVFASYNSATKQVEVSKPCYAAVKYTSYTARGALITYRPVLSAGSFGVTVNYGVVSAFLAPSSIAIYKVPLLQVDDGNIELELYRRVSYAVTTQDGEFELPPNYPSDGKYPSLSFEIDVSVSLKTQRVHEVGYMDLRGRARVDNFHVPVKTPYIGDVAYTESLLASLEFVKGTIPEKTPKGDDIPQSFAQRATSFIKSKGYGQE